MKKRIRIAQIGIGHNHAADKMVALRALTDDFEVVGFAEDNPVWLEQRGGLEAYRGLRRMTEAEVLGMEGLDAVAVETDGFELVPTALRCAERNLHIHFDKPGGESLLLVTSAGNNAEYSAGKLFRNQKRIVTVNFPESAVRKLEKETGRQIERRSSLPENEMFDDIVCADLKNRELGERALALAGNHAVVSFIGDCGNENWNIDVGALHYKNRFYQGVRSGTLDAAYSMPRRQDLRRGGYAWFPGGAGAMGQMHVELAILSPNAPSKILVTDLDEDRIEHLRSKLAGRAEERGIELLFLCPKMLSAEILAQEISAFAPDGFNDIVILVPSAKVVDQALPHLADDGLINVFAGIPAGETSAVPVRRIIENGIRFTGSSGSTTQDMKDALHAAGQHEFEPQSALAAVAGFRAVKRGLEAVAAGKFPGKIVILPDCPDLPLTPFDAEHLSPELTATLDAHGVCTEKTEEVLRRRWKKQPDMVCF